MHPVGVVIGWYVLDAPMVHLGTTEEMRLIAEGRQ